MAFPRPPFTLDKSTIDARLVRYLKDRRRFSYIQADARKLIRKLEPGDLRSQNKVLLALWPRVLADALKKLKTHDPREWDRRELGTSPASFFHEPSLGVDELRAVLESFADFEGMLYGASPDRYRDHIAHAFRVWLIGHAILMQPGCLGKKLHGSTLFDDMISSEEWQCMWAITSLCHDLGYPVSHIEEINSLARKALQGMGLVHGGDLQFSFSQHMSSFNDTIVRLMSSDPVHVPPGTLQEEASAAKSDTDCSDSDAEGREYTTHLQNKYYLKLLKSLDGLAHGVVSSVLLSKSLVYFLESDLARDNARLLTKEDARQVLIRREILRAIAAHTCQDIYHLRFDTLSFLLYIVDEIQCWGRPTLEELQHDTAGIGEANAEIRLFRPNRIAVVIWAGEDKWSAEQLEKAKGQIGKLHRMLRLGVGTAALKEHYLEFAVLPKNGEGVRLLLKNGRIKLATITKSELDSTSSAAT